MRVREFGLTCRKMLVDGRLGTSKGYNVENSERRKVITLNGNNGERL